MSFGLGAVGLGLKLGELQLPVSNLAVRSFDAKIPCPTFLDLSEALGFGDWAVGPPSKALRVLCPAEGARLREEWHRVYDGWTVLRPSPQLRV